MKLKNKNIAILATDGFETSELFSPLETLEEEGAQVDIVSPKKGEIRGMSAGEWNKAIKVDKTIDDVNSSDYDGLLIPGGVINPDQLRVNDSCIKFVDGFFRSEVQKPVAAICHGPQVLINAEAVHGRKLTSYNSIKKDLMNAGAKWEDSEVVVDNGLVTSRNPDDLAAFNRKMVEEFCEGKHVR